MPAGMQLTSLYAVGNAERRTYEFIVKAMGGVDGETAFLAEYTKFAPKAEVFKFQFTNPTEAQSEPMPFWTFGAEFEGVYKSRSNAWQAFGRLVEALKTTINCTTIEGVLSLRYLTGQPLDRVVMMADVEQEEVGGEARRWKLLLPMTVNFQNTEPEITGESNDGQND